MGPDGSSPSVRRLLEEETARGSRIIYSCDNHTPDDPEFEMFPPNCIIGSEETEIIPELAEFAGVIVPTRHYSGFYDSRLDEKLAEISPERLIVCGVCTDICVMHTVADIYFVRSKEILEKEGLNPVVTMEIFCRGKGIICGMNEVMDLLKKVLPPGNSEVWALSEGDSFQPKKVVMRITAPIQSFVIYETAYLGILSSCCAWATAARECVAAAAGIPVLSFGARHIYPAWKAKLP